MNALPQKEWKWASCLYTFSINSNDKTIFKEEILGENVFFFFFF